MKELRGNSGKKIKSQPGQDQAARRETGVSSARTAPWGSHGGGLCPPGTRCQLQCVLPHYVYKVSSWIQVIFFTAIFNLSLNTQKSLKCCERFLGVTSQKSPLIQKHFWFTASFPEKEKILSKQGWGYLESVSLSSPFSGFPRLG